MNFPHRYTAPMAKPEATDRDDILAMDIGATSIKYCLLDDDGQIVSRVGRLSTPYPCAPDTMVGLLVEQIRDSGCSRVGVGFPGEMHDGRVLEPGNLSRAGGFTSDIDESIHERWIGLDLQRALCDASERDVRVINDAALAALGCSRGTGTELVLTLGTGLGIALVVDGALVRIRDVGAEVFERGQTFDQLLGDFSRSLDEYQWNEMVVRTAQKFVLEFGADVVHLSGGNAGRVDLDGFSSVSFIVLVGDNNMTLRGARQLFPA